MSNDRFEDVAVLTTLAKLRNARMLNEQDQEDLLSQLKSDWGRQAARALIDANANLQDEQRIVLKRFSSAF